MPANLLRNWSTGTAGRGQCCGEGGDVVHILKTEGPRPDFSVRIVFRNIEDPGDDSGYGQRGEKGERREGELGMIRKHTCFGQIGPSIPSSFCPNRMTMLRRA